MVLLRIRPSAPSKYKWVSIFLWLKSMDYQLFPLYWLSQGQPTSTYIYQYMLVQMMVFPIRKDLYRQGEDKHAPKQISKSEQPSQRISNTNLPMATVCIFSSTQMVQDTGVCSTALAGNKWCWFFEFTLMYLLMMRGLVAMKVVSFGKQHRSAG